MTGKGNQMKETLEMLHDIAEHVGSDWKENVLIDNTTGIENVDAYNEGVKAMASQVCHYLSAIINARAGEITRPCCPNGPPA